MARYLDQKNDLVFKRIFGDHPHLHNRFVGRTDKQTEVIHERLR